MPVVRQPPGSCMMHLRIKNAGQTDFPAVGKGVSRCEGMPPLPPRVFRVWKSGLGKFGLRLESGPKRGEGAAFPIVGPAQAWGSGSGLRLEDA